MQNLQIGNGSNAVYFKDSGFSVEFPKQADEAEKRLQYWPAANTIGLNVVGRTGDTISIKDGTVLGGSEWNLDWDVTGITPTVSGLVVQNALVTYTNAPAQTGITYRGSDTLPSGSDLDAMVDASSSATSALTIAGATEAALQSELDNLGGSEFINNAVALRINFTGTGNISLIGPASLLFASNTVDLHYNSTNASTCTFTPGAGSNPATTSVSGNASTVINIDSSVAITLVAANIIDDSRYQLYNVTQSAELYNAVVSGGSGISQATTIGVGLAIEVGDELDLITTYNVADVFKRTTRASIIANATSNVWTTVQEPWDELEDLGLSSAGIDGVVFDDDTVNDTIDVLTNWSFAQFAVWWGLIITTELGIREWYNAITFIDSGTARINNSNVDLFLDNDQAATRWQTTTGRIYRADGARPVLDPPTSGGLDPQWLLPVLTISTGSVLTAGQQTELAASASQSAAVKVVTDKMVFTKTNELDVNTKSMNDTELAGTGISSDKFRGVGTP
jgi:hypothetical protein